MPSAQMLAKYADVAINVGIALEPGDRLLIRSSVEVADFTRVLVEQAYAAGALNVDVLWRDDAVSVARFSHGGDEASRVISSAAAAQLAAYEMGDLFLTVFAENPNAMAGQDVARVGEFQRVNTAYLEKLMTGFGSLERNWSVVAAPTPSWAGTVFPDAAETEAIELLWDSILRACRVDSGDPVSAWRDHVASLRSRREYLTSRQYTGLRYEAPGTDLWLGLPDNSRWEGGSVSSPEGREFCPNIPTEEVFVSPHLAKAEGTVKSTKPLSLYGNLIEDFALELSGGRIVGATARVGQEVLDQLLQTDEGSVRFGEAAMVPMSSAVAAEELVWNNTLFDENDGCHIAIGRSYPTTVEGGTAMDPQTQKAAGLNSSTVHVDFVVGSPELSVFGIRDDGSEEPILTDGEWGFET